jgi:hypothetical protein
MFTAVVSLALVGLVAFSADVYSRTMDEMLSDRSHPAA